MKKSKRMSAFVLCCLFVLGTLVNTSAMAATPEEIEASIEAGIEWLVGQQDSNTGQWQDVPRTGFVLIKLQDRAYETGKDPFQTDPCEPDYYEYATNVIKGWEYLFAVDGAGNPVHALKQDISDQNHVGGASGTVDDPDTRVNGYGIYFTPYTVYSSGVCLMALASSGKPNRVNDGGIDYDGDGNADTFVEIAQDVVDWLAFAQADCGAYEGGYFYGALDNSCGSADNSNAGYAYLGLAAAEGFGCTVPAWVRTELNPWITAIQDPVNGDVNDGGSWYIPGDFRGSWANELKTGNLIFEMTFYGDAPSVLRFQDAMDYIERHWQGLNVAPGWKGDKGIDDDGDSLIDEDPYDPPWDPCDDDGDGLFDEDMGRNAHYQAMYCLMKGFEYSVIDLIDLDGDNTPEHDWYQEFATVLLAQQNVNGSWPSSPCYVWPDQTYGTPSGTVLSTIWALLTLERIAPPPTNQPPDCSGAHADPGCLWPPNHKMVSVSILGVTDPDEDPVTITITSITSDEATASELGAGGPTHAPDADGVGTDTASLRAERSGRGDGRVYQINFIASDGKGGECEGSVQVNVPHDQRPSRRSPTPCDAGDDGQNYDATQIN